MKVTFCAYDSPGNIDGPTTWIKRLIPFLREKRIECRLIFFAAHDDDLSTVQFFRDRDFGCKIIFWEKFNEDKILSILKDVHEFSPDIFVANYFPWACIASKWIKAAGISTVMVLHNDDSMHHALLREFVIMEDNISAVVCVSKLLTNLAKEMLPETFGIFEIPCGVPVWDRTISINNARIMKVVYVGRIEEKQKRITRLIKSFCEAAKNVEGTEYSIYGNGSNLKEMLSTLHHEGKGLSVRYEGHFDSEEIQSKLLENHVIALLSDHEGLPVSIMEAMACGLVPVCTSIRSGIGELVIHGETGLLVSGNIPDEFAKAIKDLKHNPTLFRKISQNAREKILRNYSDLICNEKWVILLNSLQKKSTDKRPISLPTERELKNYQWPKEFETFNNPKTLLAFIPFYNLKHLLGRKLRGFKKKVWVNQK
ncbi:MAG: glycosyltransferase family 4 protein [Ginsengibacter sp.]